MPRISFGRLRLSVPCCASNNCDEGDDIDEGASEEVCVSASCYDNVVELVEVVFIFAVSLSWVCAGGLNDNEDE